MKILYAFQGTGNGHLIRAKEIIPLLQKYGDVKVATSGRNYQLPSDIRVDYSWQGITFYYNNHGGLDYFKTLRKLKVINFIREIFTLDLTGYDLIINDFEPVTGWSAIIQGKYVINLGHQAAYYYPEVPLPAIKNRTGRWILKWLTPPSALLNIGFHFKKYNEHIYTPVIRSEIRNALPVNLGHISVYLPSYSLQKLNELFAHFPAFKFEVFSTDCAEPYLQNNIHFFPITESGFTRSFISCNGIITGAGFETPAEAIYMGKKLLCIPINGQYEQQCNAIALENMGITILNELGKDQKNSLSDWLLGNHHLQILYPDQTNALIDYMLNSVNNNIRMQQLEKIEQLS